MGRAASVAAVEPGELRARRRALGLTQADLADRLGVSANTVARWERGEQRVRHPHTLARILQRLEHRRLAASSYARRDARLSRGRQSDQRIVRPGPSNSRRSDRTALGSLWHNLPAELTRFIGRAEEIEQLVQRLGSARLVTLTGPGGVGKTRLALQVARHALDHFSDGVCLVELASTTDGSMVPNVVAAVLGVREQPRISLIATLATALRDQHLLLVLDNCEHLADGCVELAHLLLRACPRLTVLATSREPLRAMGEVRWPVAPLPVSEAVQLFVDRARAVQPDFALTADNADPVVDVCARLDGLPLAIELAAARTRALPVRGLHQQLRSAGGGLPLLTGGPRDAPARHRTLHAAIAWSFDLLDPEEQVLFRRLAPFRGFTLEAATAVCIAPEQGPGSASIALPPVPLEPHAGLASLVDKSLLRVEEDAEGQPWFAMLETVREFALERLEASGEAAAVWRRHALYSLRLVEQLEPRLQDIPQDVFVKRLQREQANCRASLDWCQAQGYAEPSLRLGVGLWWFWAVRGQLAEGRSRLEAVLARFPLPPNASARRATLHAKALGASGRLAMLQGDFVGARPRLEDAVRLAQDLDDAEGLSVALEGLAYLALQQADYTLARAILERRLSTTRARARATSPADPTARWQTATTLAELGYVAFEQGDHHAAAALLEEARALAREIGDTTIAAMFDVGTPNMVEAGVNPELLLGGKYGHQLHVWDLRTRKHLQTLDLGAEQQLVFELRPARDPNKAYGFAHTVISLKDLSSAVWTWYRGLDGRWAVRKIIEIPAEPADADLLPPALKPFGAVPPLVTDLNLSLDDRQLYVSCWGTGELRQYDVSDPFAPRLTGSVRLGGITSHAPHPTAGALNGGPQMVELSRDGRRVYLSNSLYRAVDAQFYPEGIRGWVVKLVAEPGGGLRVDPTFFVPFEGERAHQIHLQGGDASSDSYCFPS